MTSDTIVISEGLIKIEDAELNQLEINALNRNRLKHYTSLDSLKTILRDETVKLSSPKNFKDENEKSSLGAFYGKIFLMSFSHEDDQNKKMWKYFGKQEQGAIIELEFEKSFALDIVKKDKLIRAYCANKNLAYSFHKYGVSYDKYKSDIDDFIYDAICVEFSLTDVDYRFDELKGICLSEYDGHELLVLNAASKYVINRYETQNETRLIAKLRCGIPQRISPIDFLLISLDFEMFSKINIYFGRKSKVDEQNEVKRIIQTKSWNTKVFFYGEK